MRHTFAVPIAIATLIVSVMAGCGGGGNLSSTTAAGGASSAGATPVCDDISGIQSAANDLKQLDASTASATDVKKVIYTLGLNAQALASDVPQTSDQTRSDLKNATNKFGSQLESAVDQPVSQQLVTLGTALSQLKRSISHTTAQFNCDQ